MKILFLAAKFCICSIIWLSVNPSSNLENFIDWSLIDLGTVASTSESRLSNPQASAILFCSSGVAELWRRGKVSLGFKASTEIERLWDPIPIPFRWNESDLTPLDKNELEDNEETYLEGVKETGEELKNGGSIWRWSFDAETRRLNAALFAANRRARSIMRKKKRKRKRENPNEILVKIKMGKCPFAQKLKFEWLWLWITPWEDNIAKVHSFPEAKKKWILILIQNWVLLLQEGALNCFI